MSKPAQKRNSEIHRTEKTMELHGWWHDEQPVINNEHGCKSNLPAHAHMQIVQWERHGQNEWIAWDGEYFHEILFCPYCGEKLEN